MASGPSKENCVKDRVFSCSLAAKMVAIELCQVSAILVIGCRCKKVGKKHCALLDDFVGKKSLSSPSTI